MKTSIFTIKLLRMLWISGIGLNLVACAMAQGTINFNEPWIGYPGEGYSYRSYNEQGFWFQVTNSYFRPPLSDMMRWMGSLGGPTVYNGTPYLFFLRAGFDDYVQIRRTDGAVFGLICVDLADVYVPSLNPITITFEGYRPGYYNPFASVTFTTAGGGISSFQTFTFPSEFSSGLAWVAITSQRWAMDNLVWIPEPGTWALLVVGVGALSYARFRRSRKGFK